MLREEEIRRLVRTVRHERLYFVTDRSGHPLLAALRDLRGEVIEANGLAGLRFLRSFQKVALGQNTLHWWAAFLGRRGRFTFRRVTGGRGRTRSRRIWRMSRDIMGSICGCRMRRVIFMTGSGPVFSSCRSFSFGTHFSANLCFVGA